jgi:hypothetical protein
MQEVQTELAKARVATRKHSGNMGKGIYERIVNNFQFRVAAELPGNTKRQHGLQVNQNPETPIITTFFTL